MVEGALKRILQLEGLALVIASPAIYSMLHASWWMYAFLFFAPDIAFLGYLAGPRVGAFAYNVMHSTIGPIALGLVAWWLGQDILGQLLGAIAAIWIGHVGFDRMLGYGLKHASGFKDTHLGKL